MFGSRRRPRSSSTPPAPSASALIAASAAYRPDAASPTASLAAAAAGAALKHAAVSPTPSDQRPGSIPTKRMLQRRDSYASITSDPVRPSAGVQRRPSSTSLTERRFRKDRSPPMTRSPVGSVRSDGTGHRSLPTTLRGKQEGRDARPSISQADTLSRQSLRAASTASPSRDTGSDTESASAGAAAAVRRSAPSPADRDAESIASFASELDSIAEDTAEVAPASACSRARRRRQRVPPSMQEVFEEGASDREDAQSRQSDAHEKRERARTQTQATTTTAEAAGSLPDDATGTPQSKPSLPPENEDNGSSLAPRAPSPPRPSTSPSRPAPRFAPSTPVSTLRRHSPPPRSLSPAKSALKNAQAHPRAPSPNTSTSTQGAGGAGGAGKARVSFSDEDSVASITHGRPALEEELQVSTGLGSSARKQKPPLPSFGSVKRAPPNSMDISSTIINGHGNGRVERGRRPDPLPHRVLSISPPPSSDEESGSDREGRSRMKLKATKHGDVMPTPPDSTSSREKRIMDIPGFNVIEPSPGEEKTQPGLELEPEPKTLAGPSRTAQLKHATTSASLTAVTVSAEHSDSSDDESMYADALEEQPRSASTTARNAAAQSTPTPKSKPAKPHLSITTASASTSAASPARNGHRAQYLPPSPPLPPSPKPRPQSHSSSSHPSTYPSPRPQSQPQSKPRTSLIPRTLRSASPSPEDDLHAKNTGSNRITFLSSLRTPLEPRPRLARTYSSDSSDSFLGKKKGLGAFLSGGGGRGKKLLEKEKKGGKAKKGAAGGGGGFVSRFEDSDSEEAAALPLPLPLPSPTLPKPASESTAPSKPTSKPKLEKRHTAPLSLASTQQQPPSTSPAPPLASPADAPATFPRPATANGTLGSAHFPALSYPHPAALRPRRSRGSFWRDTFGSLSHGGAKDTGDTVTGTGGTITSGAGTSGTGRLRKDRSKAGKEGREWGRSRTKRRGLGGVFDVGAGGGGGRGGGGGDVLATEIVAGGERRSNGGDGVGEAEGKELGAGMGAAAGTGKERKDATAKRGWRRLFGSGRS